MVGLACFKRPLETNEINLLRPSDATPAIQSVGICQPQVFLAGACRRSPPEGADLLSLPAVTCKCLHEFVYDILTTGYLRSLSKGRLYLLANGDLKLSTESIERNRTGMQEI